jgi:hypothetical protein
MKRASSAPDPTKFFAAHPALANLVRQILTGIPQWVRAKLDSGDLKSVSECFTLEHRVEALRAQGGSQFGVEIDGCVAGLAEVVRAHATYLRMFVELGPAGTQFFQSRELASWFIDQVKLKGVNPQDSAAVGILFNELVASRAESARAPDQMVIYQ